MRSITITQCYLCCLLLTACPAANFNVVVEKNELEGRHTDLVQVGKRNAWEIDIAMATVVGTTPQALATLRDVQGSHRITAAGGQGNLNLEKALKQGQLGKEKRITSGLMSRSNDLDACEPGTQIGLFRLASAHCDALVNNADIWNKFVEKNFSGASLSKLSKSHIAAVMLDSLQTGSQLNDAQREKSLATIVSYMNAAGAGDNVSKETLFEICTMVLGSASTLLN